MANPYFRFKQFRIQQDKCAMKVGTDGVLLGAWVSIQNADSILDIGTGTGLIALMLAQRSEAIIDAIDIDKEATTQAIENGQNSPFGQRIHIFNTSLADYAKTQKRYELIVSNPPFFSNTLKSPEDKKNYARHTDSLTLEELIGYSSGLLTEQGRIAFILPFTQKEAIDSIVHKNQLHIIRQTIVYPTPSSSPKRILTEVSMEYRQETITDKLVIEVARHQYTEEYIRLTKEFYLNM
jgi:tRNA1Val (adenine37-N6)-methyltransferase